MSEKSFKFDKSSDDLHEMFKRILNAATDGIVAIDKERKYFYANEAAERILGVPRDEILNRTFDQADWKLSTINGDRLPPNETPFFKVMEAREGIYGIKLIVERGDGEKVITLNNSAPLYDRDGNFEGIVVIFTDITEQHEIQEKINVVNHTVAHDLRGPLTTISGYADIIRQGIIGSLSRDDLLKYIAEVVNAADKMNKMIEELVDNSRIESGLFILYKKPVNLYVFINEIVERTHKIISTAKLTIKIPDNLPIVMVDPDRLERIFQNLLSNAIKFSPLGSNIIIAANRVGEDIRISVTDKGKGISAQDCPHIFKRYFQVKGTQESRGVGLGLYISRLLVEAHGGHIWVVSKIGEGSSFEFTLPVAKQAYS